MIWRRNGTRRNSAERTGMMMADSAKMTDISPEGR